MSVIGRIRCDRKGCGFSEDAPTGGDYPPNWGVASFKISRNPTSPAVEHFRKQRWIHICPNCAPEFWQFMGLEVPAQRTKVETGE